MLEVRHCRTHSRRVLMPPRRKLQTTNNPKEEQKEEKVVRAKEATKVKVAGVNSNNGQEVMGKATGKVKAKVAKEISML